MSPTPPVQPAAPVANGGTPDAKAALAKPEDDDEPAKQEPVEPPMRKVDEDENYDDE